MLLQDSLLFSDACMSEPACIDKFMQSTLLDTYHQVIRWASIPGIEPHSPGDQLF